MRIPATATLAKFSVVLLLLATVADFCLCHRFPNARVATAGAVIRPAFWLQHASATSRISLGSAAISSLTESLAPILPFTGGLDLRKEDYWTAAGSWYEKLECVASNIRDAFLRADGTNSAASAAADASAAKSQTKSSQRSAKRKPTFYPSLISAQQPFLSVQEISDLTLADVTESFRYAMECNTVGFNEGKFLKNKQPRVKKMIQSMQQVMSMSRGKDTYMSVANSNDFGQVDALAFSCAMRIFAEWRVVRLVPEGYKGFAVGMKLGHKDIVQNLAKIEQTVHAFLNTRQDLLSLQAQFEENGTDENCPIDGSIPRELRSPTLKEVMQYEVDMAIIPADRLPRLKDNSGSMGVLWSRRQLHYQTLLFGNVMKIPSQFPATSDATVGAYKEVYDRFHGWAVQKIFNYSFQSAPEADIIFRHMNHRKLKEAADVASKMKFSIQSTRASDDPVDSVIKDEDVGHLWMVLGKSFLSECYKVASHVGSEWDKLVGGVVRVFDKDQREAYYNDRDGVGEIESDLESSQRESFISKVVIADAHSHISEYLAVALPLLADLAFTFDKLNMDDPSRV
jgi:hypothetical protein